MKDGDRMIDCLKKWGKINTEDKKGRRNSRDVGKTSKEEKTEGRGNGRRKTMGNFYSPSCVNV